MPFYGIKSPAKRLDCHATGLLSEDIFQQSSGQPFWRATKDRRNSNKLEVKRDRTQRLLDAVAHNFTRRHKNDILCDIGAEISNSLQIR